MARPKVPLISRRAAIEAALQIIDDEGLDAFSIRRLADRLGVNGASLYHHFANKEEIVVKAAELALAKVRTPETTDESWHVWLPRNARLLGEAVRQHPELVPIIVRRSELGMGIPMMESSAARLVEEGVPIGAVVPLLDALETFAVGAAIHQTRGVDPTVDDADGSVLSRAVAEQSLSFDEMYDVVSVAIVESVAAAVAAKRPRRAARKRTATKPAAVPPAAPAAAAKVAKAATRVAEPAARAGKQAAGRATAKKPGRAGAAKARPRVAAKQPATRSA